MATRDDTKAHHVLSTRGYHPASDLVLTDDHAIEHPEQVATVLVKCGVPPVQLLVEEEDLETYFLRVVGADNA
ncbi:hypothetical protein [Nonomuraea dietziae]|uniref:hypothetical protein n=1 Tax=Nonomuraea dietziae TaxID=65515 RepID=UPI0031D567C9